MPTEKSRTRLTRGMLERLLYIDDLLRRKQPVTCSTIARHFGRRRGTIQQDMDHLRNTMGRPLEFDGRRNTWRYTEEVGPLPDEVITEGELFTMMVARASLEQFRGTPFFARLTRCAEKLARSLKTRVPFSAGDYARRVSFRGLGRPKIDPAVFNTVSRGMARRVEVAFDYRKPGDGAVRRRTAQLWHAAYRGAMWYAIGYDREAGGRRTFALTRMSNPVLTPTKFTVPADFSPEQHFANAFSVLGGDGDHRIVIRFRGAGAVRVQECEWHESEKWRPLPNGEVELRLRLGALDEIARWVLSWGADAEVIEPRPLRERVAATVATLGNVYRAPEPGRAA